MAREPETAATFRHDPPMRLGKEKFVVRCDDGSVYEFEKPDGDPKWHFVHSVNPDGSMSNTGSRKRLPDAVATVANSVIEGWSR